MPAYFFAIFLAGWWVNMLEPRDRLLLFEALRPPLGFRFDEGVGTTYSLDLLALLTVPLAFTLFEQQDEEDPRAGVDSLEILESLRRHADQLTVFCHAGRTFLPKKFYPQLAFVEDAIVPCKPHVPGAFHSKVWVLRWVNDSGGVQYRVLVLSRNLTFARSWDTLLKLDGKVLPSRRTAIARNRGLSDFVRALPTFATPPVNTQISQRTERLASELDRTEFELPNGMTDLRFWPMGIDDRVRDPLAVKGDRLLVVSPFVSLRRLEELAEGREEVALVSARSELARLARKPKGIGRFFGLKDRAVLEVDSEHEEKPESETEAIQQSDLHAKMYVSESGWDAHIWTGSANATEAAFKRNVEFVVELIGPRKQFGIDALMQQEKGEIRFINLLEDIEEFVAREKPDSAIETLERKLENLRESIASTRLQIIVTPAVADAFDVELVCKVSESVAIDSEVTARCWPLTVPSSAGVQFDKLDPGAIIAKFPALSFQAITAFCAFELTGHARGEERQVRFVLNLPLIGAPDGRREMVLRSLVRDRSTMMHFLCLLLADEGFDVPEMPGTNLRGNERGDMGSAFVGNGLFEMLLRNLDRSPERLGYLNSLLQDLRKGADDEDLLPDGFDAIWEPIWRQSQRLGRGAKV
jgi:hypothetical protein